MNTLLSIYTYIVMRADFVQDAIDHAYTPKYTSCTDDALGIAILVCVLILFLSPLLPVLAIFGIIWDAICEMVAKFFDRLEK